MLAIGVTKAQDAAATLAPVRVAMVAAFDTPAGVPDGFEIRTDHGPKYTGVAKKNRSTLVFIAVVLWLGFPPR